MKPDHQQLLDALRGTLTGPDPQDADDVIQQVSTRAGCAAEDVVYVLVQAAADGIVDVDRKQRLILAQPPPTPKGAAAADVAGPALKAAAPSPRPAEGGA